MTLLALGFPAQPLERTVVVPAQASTADALEQLRRLDPPSDVIVLARDQPGSDAHEHRARVLRSLGERPDVALLCVSEPASRAALLLRCLDFLAQYLAPVDVHAVAPAVNAALRTVALLDSVSRLRRPAPKVLQHGLGLVPGSRFGVDLDAGTVGSPSSLPAPRTETVVASALASVDADGWADALPGAVAEPTVRLVDVEPRDFWGARRWAELSVLPEPLELVVERALQQPAVPCPVCERRLRHPWCPYCGVLPTSLPVPDHTEVAAP